MPVPLGRARQSNKGQACSAQAQQAGKNKPHHSPQQAPRPCAAAWLQRQAPGARSRPAAAAPRASSSPWWEAYSGAMLGAHDDASWAQGNGTFSAQTAVVCTGLTLRLEPPARVTTTFLCPSLPTSAGPTAACSELLTGRALLPSALGTARHMPPPAGAGGGTARASQWAGCWVLGAPPCHPCWTCWDSCRWRRRRLSCCRLSCHHHLRCFPTFSRWAHFEPTGGQTHQAP